MPPKNKRTATAAMAPRMQSQVQKWARMTADLAGAKAATEAASTLKTDSCTAKTARRGKTTATTAAEATARAPHRRDRYESFGVQDSAGLVACVLCMVRFGSRQQLRDHEALSTGHRQRVRDAGARRQARGMVRGGDLSRGRPGEMQGGDLSRARPEEMQGDELSRAEPRVQEDKAETAKPMQTFVQARLPRRRGDPAPVYTSYAAPVNSIGSDGSRRTAHACLLCRRRFQRLATLRLHERESVMHRSRTRDPAAVAAAAEAVTAAGSSEKYPPLLRMRPRADRSQYRDRARERRLVLGGKSSGQTAAAAHKTVQVAAAHTAVPTKGAAMLGKMGWTAGHGLGAQGTGLTTALAPAAYVPGVGLGADGGRIGDAAALAAQRTEAHASGGDGYAAFVEQAQEKARQRYRELAEESK